MADDDVADLIADCYGAAAGAVGWSEVQRQLCQVLAAPFAGLAIGDPRIGGRLINLFGGEDAVLPPERLHNPFLEPARRIWAGVHERRPVVALGPEVVDDAGYVGSEYYADHGRRLEMRHEVGTTVMVDTSSITALGIYRPDRAGPFGERDRAVLLALRPHLRRALQLREALRPARTAALAGHAALDAMAQAVVLVDADMRVLHANPAALALASDGQGIGFRSSAPSGGPTQFHAKERVADAALRRLAASVARGGSPGSAIRVGGGADATPVALVVAVLPVPAPLVRHGGPAGAAEGLALVFIRKLAGRVPPPAQMLCDLFGLTRSEADVATMLTRGAPAARIAGARGVSVDTVRTQIRAVLRKVGAANLRDLEATLGAVSG